MGDEPGLLEDAQVLRDGRAAHRKIAGEVADRPRPRAQQLEDLPPGRIAQRVERMSVSFHLP
jgi:hypothetical protein